MTYRLDANKNPIPCEVVAADWGDDARRVALDVIGDITISTVFLVLDNNFSGIGAPILFETMTFEGKSLKDLSCARYKTYTEALDGHARICEEIARNCNLPVVKRSL